MNPLLVLVTVPDAGTGAVLGRLLVERRLAACVNRLGGVASVYRWEGKVEEAGECLLLIKSSRERWESLQAAIREAHPYACPEIVALRPETISAGYAKWWEEALGEGKP